MKLNLRKRTANRVTTRMKNKSRIRKKVQGTAERPRLCVYRSGRNMYAQVVDDVKMHTIIGTSTLKLNLQKKSSCEAAKALGAEVAKLAKEKKINNVVFDRSGYVYHGRVKAVADGAREAGLNF